MEKISRSIPVTRPYKLPLESNKWGGASFNRNSGFIDAGNNASLNLTGDKFGLIFSFIPKIITGNDVIISKGITGTKVGFIINIITGNKIQTALGNSVVQVTYGSINSVIINKLVNIAIIYDTGTLTYYFDGVLDSSVATITPVNSIKNFEINSHFGLPSNRTFELKGIIYFSSNVPIQPQIQDLMYGRILPTQFDCRLWHDYRLGHARDLSGNGNHGTINGNVRFV